MQLAQLEHLDLLAEQPVPLEQAEQQAPLVLALQVQLAYLEQPAHLVRQAEQPEQLV